MKNPVKDGVSQLCEVMDEVAAGNDSVLAFTWLLASLQEKTLATLNLMRDSDGAPVREVRLPPSAAPADET